MPDDQSVGFWQAACLVGATGVVSCIGHALVAALQRKNEKDRALEAEKRETYKKFMMVLFDILRSSKSIKENKSLGIELEDKFYEVARDITVYASDEVLDLWVKFKNMGQETGAEYVLSLVGEMMAAIRIDLGHESTKYGSKELLSTFITDIGSLKLPSVR